MSKPREIWWSYAKAMVREYPDLHEQYRELHSQNITANLSCMPGGGNGGSRTVENVALRELPGIKQREYHAVAKAIEITGYLDTGKERLNIIELVYWRQDCNLEQAAYKLHLSVPTAMRYHRQFIHLVGKCFGLRE